MTAGRKTLILPWEVKDWGWGAWGESLPWSQMWLARGWRTAGGHRGWGAPWDSSSRKNHKLYSSYFVFVLGYFEKGKSRLLVKLPFYRGSGSIPLLFLIFQTFFREKIKVWIALKINLEYSFGAGVQKLIMGKDSSTHYNLNIKEN